MDLSTARGLCRVNDWFYRENAAAFSSTRSAPWNGWSRCLEVARGEFGLAGTVGVRPEASCRVSEPRVRAYDEACSKEPAQGPVRVLDVACGNLRFEEFLARGLSGVPISCVALDDCEELAESACGDGLTPASSAVEVRFKAFDVLGCLADASEAGDGATRPPASSMLGKPASAALCRELFAASGEAPFDMAVCFGFMHHVPLPEWREALLRALAGCVRPGGVVCVSFWRFLDDDRLARKAAEATERALREASLRQLADGFESGDRFLGWQNRADSFRYCHHFSSEEIDGLSRSVSDIALEVARFRADGKSAALNEYVVWRA